MLHYLVKGPVSKYFFSERCSHLDQNFVFGGTTEREKGGQWVNYILVDTLGLSLSPGSKVGRVHRVFLFLVPAFVRSVCAWGDLMSEGV